MSAHSLSRIRCASLLVAASEVALSIVRGASYTQSIYSEERHGGEGTEKTHTTTPPLRFFLPSSPHGLPPIVAHLCEVWSDRSGAGGVLRMRQVRPRTHLPISSLNALKANLGTTTGVSPKPRCTPAGSLLDSMAQERFSRSGPSVVRARCCSGTRACARRTSRRILPCYCGCLRRALRTCAGTTAASPEGKCPAEPLGGVPSGSHRDSAIG